MDVINSSHHEIQDHTTHARPETIQEALTSHKSSSEGSSHTPSECNSSVADTTEADEEQSIDV